MPRPSTLFSGLLHEPRLFDQDDVKRLARWLDAIDGQNDIAQQKIIGEVNEVGDIGGATAQYQYIVSGVGPGYTAAWSGGFLNITIAKTFAVQNTLTLAGSDDDLVLTIPTSGTSALGAGTLSGSTINDATIADHTHAITGSPALAGNGSAQYQFLVTGPDPYTPVWSGGFLIITTGKAITSEVDTTFFFDVEAGRYTINFEAQVAFSFKPLVTGAFDTNFFAEEEAGFESIRLQPLAGGNYARLRLEQSGAGNLTFTLNDGGTINLGGFTASIPITGTTAMGAGTLSASTINDATIAAHTHAITGSPALAGNGSAQYQFLVTGGSPFAPVWSSGFLNITATKTLTIDESIEIDASGAAVNEVLIHDGAKFVSALLPDEAVLHDKIGSPALFTLHDDWITRGSAGVIDGTQTYVEADPGAGTRHIKVNAGDGYLRATNDQQGELKFIHWAAATAIEIPAPAAGQETTRFVGVEYNSGAPQYTVRTTFNWNWYSDFPLARVSYDGTTLRILNAYAHSEDTANFARRVWRLTHPFIREEAPEGSGGLEVSDVATRQLAVTAGNVWHGFNRYVLSAIAAGTAFDTHYRRAGGGFNSTVGVTQWPNTEYDDGSGALVTMINNRYACLWVYIDVSDGSLDVMYGRDQYVTVVNAQAESVPDTPAHLTYHGRLLGRLIFQKSASSATLVESAWAAEFTPSVISDHNLLSGLQGGAASEYYHLTAAQHTALIDGSGTATRMTEWVDGNTLQASTLIKAGAGVLTISAGGTYSFTLDAAMQIDTTGAAPTNVLVYDGAKWVPGAAGTGTVDGTGTATRMAEWVDSNTLQASTLIKAGAGVLTISAGGTYSFTLDAAMQIDTTGAAPTNVLVYDGAKWVPGTAGTGTVDGTGTATRMAEWVDTDTIQASTLIKAGAGILIIGSDQDNTLDVQWNNGAGNFAFLFSNAGAESLGAIYIYNNGSLSISGQSYTLTGGGTLALGGYTLTVGSSFGINNLSPAVPGISIENNGSGFVEATFQDETSATGIIEFYPTGTPRLAVFDDISLQGNAAGISGLFVGDVFGEITLQLYDAAGNVGHFRIAPTKILTVSDDATVSGTNTGDQTLPTGANPTASVELAAVNGVATTFMRSDAAPALSVAITPTWSGIHTFGNVTDSSSTSTGAIVTSGGIGIAKALSVGTYVGIGAVPSSLYGLYIDHSARAAILRVTDAGTTNAPGVMELRHNTSGTPAVGFGIAINWTADTDGAESQVLISQTATWATATDASRKGKYVLSVWDTAQRTAYQAESNGSAIVMTFPSAVNSTSTTTGALVISGGVGIAQAVVVGGTLTEGDGTSSADMILDGAAGNFRSLQYRTGGSSRWILRANSTAEGGSNAGTNFEFSARADDGSLIGTAIAITRSSMAISLAGIVTASNTTDSTSSANGSIVTAGGVGIAKALNVGTTAGIGKASTTNGLEVSNSTTDFAFYIDDAGTNNVPTMGYFIHNSSDTPVNGFGYSISHRLKSSSTNTQIAGSDEVVWATADHATRKARRRYIVNDAAASREIFRGEASGTAAMVGFLGANAVARQVVGAAAPAGGTGATAGAYDTAANRNAMITLLNNIRTALINLGLCSA